MGEVGCCPSGHLRKGCGAISCHLSFICVSTGRTQRAELKGDIKDHRVPESGDRDLILRCEELILLTTSTADPLNGHSGRGGRPARPVCHLSLASVSGAHSPHFEGTLLLTAWPAAVAVGRAEDKLVSVAAVQAQQGRADL